MLINKYFLFLLTILSLPIISQASSESSLPHCYSIILPGQNGGGGDSYQRNNIVNSAFKAYTTLDPKSGKVDLGQGNCVKDFLKQISEDNSKINQHENIILHGVSQGTATVVRAFSQLPEEIRAKVKCLVLESVLANGNSAIVDTTKNFISSKILYLPLSRQWLPWIGKLLFPTYNPLAKQTLYYAQSLPTDLPIIIMHDVNDFQLSINDARNLYYTIYNKRNDCTNKNVYLIETNSTEGAHLDILDYDALSQDKKFKIQAIQQIYKNNQLPYNEKVLSNNQTVDLKTFQPSLSKVKNSIYQTNKQYHIHNIIDSLFVVALLGTFCFLYKLLTHTNTQPTTKAT